MSVPTISLSGLRTDGPRPLLEVTAAELMKEEVFALRQNDCMFRAASELVRRGYSGAPVVDELGRLVGMLSEHDCIKAVLAQLYYQDNGLLVGEHMSRELTTVHPETPLLMVAELFVRKHKRRLPVVDGNMRLLGQVSRTDLLRASLTAFQVHPDQSAPSLYLSALGAPPPHRTA